MVDDKKINFDKLFKSIQPCYMLEDEKDEILLRGYFSKCFDDLLSRMQIKQEKINSAISKTVLSGYINFPLVVSNRIFEAFQQENEDNLGRSSFVNGMFGLYFGNLEKLEAITFDIMNINLNGKITKENVNLLLNFLNFSCGNLIQDTEEIVENTFSHEKELTFENYVTKIKNKNSNILILILMLIYSKQPFTEDVIQFYRKNWGGNCKNYTKSSFSKKEKTYIFSPDDHILFYLKYLQGKEFFSKPKRKRSSKNILKFHDFYEFTGICNKIEKNDTAINCNYANNFNSTHNEESFTETYHTEEDFLSMSIDSIDTKASTHSMSTKSSLTNLNNSSYYEFIVYKLNSSNNSSNSNFLTKLRMTLIDNNLFSFNCNNLESDIEGIHPLSGCYLTICDEIKIQKYTLFPFAILRQYGNAFANVKNIFLSTTKENLIELMAKLQDHMKIRNIQDRYEIDVLNRLGSGVFGTVSLGEDKLTGEKVAVKMINKNNLTFEGLIEMVKNEIDILKILKLFPHPNVVSPLDIFEDRQFIYYVLEYVPYGTLESYYEEKKFLNEFEVLNIVKQMADALGFLNKFGIIHRDIKLENILLKNKEESKVVVHVKLSDFGLSTVKFLNQTTNENCGTLFYSAPEIISKLPYDKKVDIWSLGVFTYYLAFGVFPFQATNKADLVSKIINEDLKFPKEKKKPHKLQKLDESYKVNESHESYELIELSDECKYFICKCLMKNPKDRFDIQNVLKTFEN